jgi:hypothetical protein
VWLYSSFVLTTRKVWPEAKISCLVINNVSQQADGPRLAMELCLLYGVALVVTSYRSARRFASLLFYLFFKSHSSVISLLGRRPSRSRISAPIMLDPLLPSSCYINASANLSNPSSHPLPQRRSLWPGIVFPGQTSVKAMFPVPRAESISTVSQARRKYVPPSFPTLYFKDSILSVPGYVFEKVCTTHILTYSLRYLISKKRRHHGRILEA